MDSPFNKGFGPGHQSAALSQAPPAGSAYQVNVNRTKTKKWVEARVQSYDGDDWGADEYHDLDHDEPPPVQQLSSTQRPAGVASLPSSLHAQQTRQSLRSPPALAHQIIRARNWRNQTSRRRHSFARPTYTVAWIKRTSDIASQSTHLASGRTRKLSMPRFHPNRAGWTRRAVEALVPMLLTT
ncbi:hypothetical protein OCS_06888 [Ophiocordyceps sinensis CO18]|uniref:Uncharacterized protein n=1 Tax=Ophiocordyceps sinensis (strain Co18 / CGMCC 3.14243) TaxID=911162 RepID=T4ZWC5_OPHSC|nr:hypothetical protein OCS_06888 [Ophiocordyceps sinensis CO18]